MPKQVEFFHHYPGVKMTKEEVIKMLKTFTPLERALEFEKLFLLECSKLNVKPMYSKPIICGDGSFMIEVYYGKQGAWNSKRLGFDFEPDGGNFFWYIGRGRFKHSDFRGDGHIEDLSLPRLLKLFYKEALWRQLTIGNHY
jgi:hypothetical protein